MRAGLGASVKTVKGLRVQIGSYETATGVGKTVKNIVKTVWCQRSLISGWLRKVYKCLITILYNFECQL